MSEVDQLLDKAIERMMSSEKVRLRRWITLVRDGKATPQEVEEVTGLLWLLTSEVGNDTLQALMNGTVLEHSPGVR